MSELQDRLDLGEITSDEYHASWIAQMEESERLHPGIHDRLYQYLMAKYPGPGVEADAFFGLVESDGVSTQIASSGPSGTRRGG